MAVSGVPQGGHLSPLLYYYLLMMLVLYSSNYLLFVDDLKIYLSINSMDNSILPQNDLNKFSEWYLKSCFSVNAEKFKCISFSRQKNKMFFPYTINGFPLSYSTTMRDLGVLLYSELTFNNHIDTLYNKTLRILGFIKRICSKYLYILY